MSRSALLVLGGALGVAVLALVIQFRGLIPDGPCRIRSVDEAEYVAGNRAILDEVPLYPGSTREHSDSNPWYAGDACLSVENSGPIDRYQTRDMFTLPSEGRPIVSAPWKVSDKFGNHRIPAQVPAVLIHYDTELRQRGWQRYGWWSHEVSFRKDDALLTVSADLGIGDPYKREPLYFLAVVRGFD